MTNPVTVAMPPHTTLDGVPIHPDDWTLRAWQHGPIYLTHNTDPAIVHRVTGVRRRIRDGISRRPIIALHLTETGPGSPETPPNHLRVVPGPETANDAPQGT